MRATKSRGPKLNLSGHTLPFAVLGHPIGHTLSPVMHNANFQALGMDAVYTAYDVAPEKLLKVLPAMADMGYKGVNLTVPLKEVAFRGLARLDDSARALGAVNTVEFTADGLRGHNTDGKGFLLAIYEAFGRKVRGLSVFVLGAGGAGRAIAITCAKAGAKSIRVADVDPARARRVAAEIAKTARASTCEAVPGDASGWAGESRRADLVVQATPVGMKKGDPSLLPPAAFRKDQMVFDLVYMYPRTSFMKAAEAAGASTANGLGMLLHQGAWAFTIWTGKKANVEIMRRSLEQVVYGKRKAKG